MKICKDCGAEKPLSCFYKHKKMKDGHLNKCKECTKTQNTANRNKNIEYYREYDRLRDTPERQRIRGNDRRAIYPEKYSARAAVSYAIQRGKLIKQPCCVCGTLDRIEAHHEDYSKPLEVVWMCNLHHTEYHKGIKVDSF